MNEFGRFTLDQEPLIGTPVSAEDSRFFNPITVEIAGLLNDYVCTAARPRQEKALIKFMNYCSKDEVRQQKARSYLDQVIESITNRDESPDQNTRLALYREVKTKFDGFFPPYLDIPLATSQVSLPSASVRINMPQEAIQLTNEVIKAVYPTQSEAFYELQYHQVIVVPNTGLKRFVSQLTDAHILGYTGQRRTALLNSLGLYRQEAKPYMWSTFSERPGRPILVSEDQFRGMDIMKSEQLALLLTHEALHRNARFVVLPVQEYPNLFELAFSTEHFARETATPESIPAITTYLDELREFATTHSSLITINGAHITLYTKDDTGKYLQVVSSGYDINEAIVECLAEKPRANILEVVKRRYPAKWYAAVKNSAEELQGSQGTYGYQNPYPYINGLMRKLGLNTKEEILEAYLFGRIPFLWLQHTPLDQSYT